MYEDYTRDPAQLVELAVKVRTGQPLDTVERGVVADALIDIALVTRRHALHDARRGPIADELLATVVGLGGPA